VIFNGAGAVVPGGGLFFTHNDSFPPSFPLPVETINCSLSITGGSYAVDPGTGAGNVTMNLTTGAELPGEPPCIVLGNNPSASGPASLTFAFVLNNSRGSVATSASLQLIGFSPAPLFISGPPLPPAAFQAINGMNLQGTLGLQSAN
jgi:hypothetical protein